MSARPVSPAAYLQPARSLTKREHEVIDWIAQGKRDCEIAQIIGVSVRTVEHHVSSILHKLHVETRTAAACMQLQRRRKNGYLYP